ncbi:MAG: VOC family protein [Lapillicoccus sp.]
MNAPDALALARFFAALTDGVATGDSHWAATTGPNGFLAFQQVDRFRAPTWPDGCLPAHMHLDFVVDDLDATGMRALAAGATRLEVQPNADHCIVYADPAGHPFCLSTWEGQALAAHAPGGCG